MTNTSSQDQALLARESLVKRVEYAGYLLLTNMPMAMSGQPDRVTAAYAVITAGAAVLHIAIGAAVWVVRVRLKA